MTALLRQQPRSHPMFDAMDRFGAHDGYGSVTVAATEAGTGARLTRNVVVAPRRRRESADARRRDADTPVDIEWRGRGRSVDHDAVRSRVGLARDRGPAAEAALRERFA